MTPEAYKLFSQMFEADRNIPEGQWLQRFPMYKYDAAMGAKPWWPPLSEVWFIGERCPDAPNGSASVTAWPEAWACLQRHCQEYVDAKQQRKRPKRT